MNKAFSSRNLPHCLRLCLPLVIFMPAVAMAHPGHGATGFAQGIMHPLSGLDHLLAMVAVGLFAAQRGGRALWLVPLAFVSVLVVGGALGMAGGPLPLTEAGIVASVLILGVLIAAAVPLPLAASMVLVGVFALFHGYAHGAEMSATVSGWFYGMGFVFTTVCLHLCGLGIGLAAQKNNLLAPVRYAGAAIAAWGVYLMFLN